VVVVSNKGCLAAIAHSRFWHKADFRRGPAVMSAFGSKADIGRRTVPIISAASDPKRT